MPWQRNDDLPAPIKEALPPAAQTIFRLSYNAAFNGSCKGDESCAMAVAWTTVKKRYKKTDRGWVRKAEVRFVEGDDELAEDVKEPQFTWTGEGLLVEFGKSRLHFPMEVRKEDEDQMIVEQGDIFCFYRSAPNSNGWKIFVDGRQVVWLPEADHLPYWATDVDLVFTKSDISQAPNAVPIDKVEPWITLIPQGPAKREVPDSPPRRSFPSTVMQLAARALGLSKNADEESSTTYSYAITKATSDKRFTLGPLYMPDRLDAHKEFTDAEELQNSVWNYVKTSQSRQIYLQHSKRPAGEWLEIVTWPYAVQASATIPGQEPVDYEFPPNTVYLGVLWQQWAWDLVKAGKLRGFSIGGMARRLEVEFEQMPYTNSNAS